MDPMFLLICGCILGMAVLVGWSIQQSQASPQMDLREKLKNLAKDPEAMAREIELGAERKSPLSAIDFRGIFTKFTGQSYMDNLEKELTQCDIPLKPGEFLAVRFGAAILAGLVAILISHNPIIAIAVLGFVGLVLHIPVLKIKRSMRI